MLPTKTATTAETERTMKIDLTNEQRAALLEAMDMKIASNKRSQNTSKKPEFTELYRREETILRDVFSILTNAK